MSTCQHPVKLLLYSSLLFIFLLSLVACGDKSDATAEIAVAQVTPSVDLTKENDKRFLIRAVEMKYEQILLGKLAQTRAGQEEIKSFGKMLEEANRNSKSTLSSLAIMESITVPSAPTHTAHAAYEQLNQGTVEEFDDAYIEYVIRSHSDAITLFENATSGSIDPDIQAKASSLLPELRDHLSKAKELNAQMNPVSELVQE